MAVSDIYQALSEDRPYRKTMEKEKAFKILDQLVAKNHLANNVAAKLKDIV